MDQPLHKPPLNSSSTSQPSNSKEDFHNLEQARKSSNPRRKLSKQLSMCELPRDQAWERRRHQFHRQERRRNKRNSEADLLTDEDLNELKGCIDLGFGFTEQNGQNLCSTIPALDLYFAVNRQFSCSPISSPGSKTSTSTADSDSWKIITPGEDPRHIKTKLRHWAQAVACSLKQSS